MANATASKMSLRPSRPRRKSESLSLEDLYNMLLLITWLLWFPSIILTCSDFKDHQVTNKTLLRRWYSLTAGDEEVWPNGDVWWCYTMPEPVETYDPFHQTSPTHAKSALERAFKQWNPNDEINVTPIYCGICPCEQFKNALKVSFLPPGAAWRSWVGCNVHNEPNGGNLRITWEGASEKAEEPEWQRFWAHEIGHVFGFMHEHQRHELWYPWDSRQFQLNCINLKGFVENFMECVPDGHGGHMWTGAVIPEQVRKDLAEYTPFKYEPGARYEYEHLCEAGADGYRYAMYAGAPTLAYLPFPAANYGQRKTELISGGNVPGYRLDYESIMLYGSDERGATGAFRWKDGGLIPRNQVPSARDIDRLRQIYGVREEYLDSDIEEEESPLVDVNQMQSTTAVET